MGNAPPGSPPPPPPPPSSSPPTPSRIPVMPIESANTMPTFSGDVSDFTLTTPVLIGRHIHGLDSVAPDGGGTVFLIDGNNVFKRAYGIPPGSAPGMPSDLLQLQKLIGKHNMTISYSFNAFGEVSQYTCFKTLTLIGSLTLQDGTVTSSRDLVSTSGNLLRHKPNSGWVSAGYIGPELATTLNTGHRCTGDCWCGRFVEDGGFEEVHVSLRINVKIDMDKYCLAAGTNNIASDFCFTYMSDNVPPYDPKTNKGGMVHDMEKYLKTDFCPRNVKNGLDYFTDKNAKNPAHKLCACNMADNDYKMFVQSIGEKFPSLSLGSVQAQCLLPACLGSVYKATTLNGCPTPQCFQVINISKSQLAGPVNISQNSDCVSMGLSNEKAAPGTPIAEPGEAEEEEGEGTAFTRTNIAIIVGVVIVIIIIIVVLVFVFSGDDKKGYERI